MAENYHQHYPSACNVLAFSSLYTIHEQSSATSIATTLTASPSTRIHPWTSTIQHMRAAGVNKQQSSSYSSSSRELLYRSSSENKTGASLQPKSISSPNRNNNNNALLAMVRKPVEFIGHPRRSTTTTSHSQHSIPREIRTTTAISHINCQDNKTETSASTKDENGGGAYYFTFDTPEMDRSKSGKRQLDDHKTIDHYQKQQHHNPSTKQKTKLKKKKRSSDNDISARLMNGPGRVPPSVRAIQKKERFLLGIDNKNSMNQRPSSPFSSSFCTDMVVFDIFDQQLQHNGVPPPLAVNGNNHQHHDARLEHLFFPQGLEANIDTTTTMTSTTTTTSMGQDLDTGTSVSTETAAANKKKTVHWNLVNVYIYRSLSDDEDNDAAGEQEEEVARGESNDEAKTFPTTTTTILVKPKPTKCQVLRAKVRALPIKSASFSTSNLSNCFRRRRQKLSFLDRFMKERQVEMKKKHQQEDPRLREVNEKWAVSYGGKNEILTMDINPNQKK